MPLKSGQLSVGARGEQAGRLAAREMFRTMSLETGAVQGAAARLELVGDLVASQHQQAGMASAEVRSWRLAFQAGVGIETAEHFRRAKATIFPAR